MMRVVSLAALAAVLIAAPARGMDPTPRATAVTSVSIVAATGKAEVVIGIAGSFDVEDFALEAPYRIVLDLSGATLGLAPQMYDRIARGGIKNIRYAQYRTSAQAKYQRNLALSKLPDFAQRMRYFILNHDVKVVRIHTGGEFHSAKYVRKWLRIATKSPKVKFFTYTRAWRIPAIREVLEELSRLPNVELWYSADRETGTPPSIPPLSTPSGFRASRPTRFRLEGSDDPRRSRIPQAKRL